MTAVNFTPSQHQQLQRGPDALRSTSGVAFIYTKYPSPSGQRFFAAKNVGHEVLLGNDEIIEALFGPRLNEPLSDQFIRNKIGIQPDEDLNNVYAYKRAEYNELQGKTLRDLIGEDVDEYEKTSSGFKPTGKKRWNWKWDTIRQLTKNESLYGRYGNLHGTPVIMLWPPPKNWQPMLHAVLKHLEVSPDDNQTAVTVGTDVIFTPQEFYNRNASNLNKDVESHLQNDKERLELLSQYHTATGAEKQRIAKLLGLDSNKSKPYPAPGEEANFPWKRWHWRNAAYNKGVSGVFDYGEGVSDDPYQLDFKNFLD